MPSESSILHVDLGERSYPIYIGAGILSDRNTYRRAIPGRQVMIVSNETVAPLYLNKLIDALKGFSVATLVLPDGEEYKTLETLNRIYTSLLEHQFDRSCTLLALGGGVVGDMTGYAAASYQRGVHFLQVPTTLLAQVDSSVGGKTGVNHALGKNMIGAFHQPLCVVADTDVLDTLPDRELSAGLAEVIKYGLINDPEFFAWLEANVEALVARDAEALTYAIRRSCADKAKIVAEDEREAGKRALLNLGHTFGHAIENGMGYGVWLHGEAVATGMCMAARLSRSMGWLDEESVVRIERLVLAAGLPIVPPTVLSAETQMESMAVDKKAIGGSLGLVLLKGIGESFLTRDVPRASLLEVLKHGAEP